MTKIYTSLITPPCMTEAQATALRLSLGEEAFQALGEVLTRNEALALPNVTEGTGITVWRNGAYQSGVFQATYDYTAFQIAATTKNILVCKAPARSQITRMMFECTTAFDGTAGTLAVILGTASGGNQILASTDVKSAPIVAGLINDEIKVTDIADVVQAGAVLAWDTTSDVYMRLTSGTGNLEDLTVGSLTITIEYSVLP